MKSLYLVRHAKSSWDFPELADIDRPLITKGEKRTKRIIEFLTKEKIVPDLIISSPAVRAMETAKLIAEGVNYKIEKIKIERNIYFGDTDSYFDALYQLNDEIKSVMVFGHNPTITQFANYFKSEKIDYLPTSGVVHIKFDTDKWTKIPNCKWSEDFTITPKILKNKKDF